MESSKSKVYISANAAIQLKEYLLGLDYELCPVEKSADVDDAITCHPDVYMCADLKGKAYHGDKSLLGPHYPDDVLYNAAPVGDYLICSKYTSPELIEFFGLKPIIVQQGYVKCNLAVLDDKHVITEDRGMVEVIKTKTDLQCLLISHHQVSLPGYKYGFIGGATGRIPEAMIFNGNIKAHSDFAVISKFVSSCGITLKYFEDYPLTDIGSIIYEKEK